MLSIVMLNGVMLCFYVILSVIINFNMVYVVVQEASYKKQLFIFLLKLVSTFKPILNTIIKKLII